jgi:hypothetical protein
MNFSPIGDSNWLVVPASGFDIDYGLILDEYPPGVQISRKFTRQVQKQHQQELKFISIIDVIT